MLQIAVWHDVSPLHVGRLRYDAIASNGVHIWPLLSGFIFHVCKRGKGRRCGKAVGMDEVVGRRTACRDRDREGTSGLGLTWYRELV